MPGPQGKNHARPEEATQTPGPLEQAKLKFENEMLAGAEQARKELIADYRCYRNGRYDPVRTKEYQADLEKLEVQVNGKRDIVRTLNLVKEALAKLP